MQKIPTLFKRDPEDMSRVTEEVHPDCQWVLDGEGVATRKYDGTCVMLDEDNRWWARREVKKDKIPPQNFQAISTDEITGKTVGWEPIDQSPFVKMWKEGYLNAGLPNIPGTYELCGPKINKNPEEFDTHILLRHEAAEQVLIFSELSYQGIRLAILDLESAGWEGIVWHHPDGRMAKIKARDFKGETDA